MFMFCVVASRFQVFKKSPECYYSFSSFSSKTFANLYDEMLTFFLLHMNILEDTKAKKQKYKMLSTSDQLWIMYWLKQNKHEKKFL